jgi:hypothetical protein
MLRFLIKHSVTVVCFIRKNIVKSSKNCTPERNSCGRRQSFQFPQFSGSRMKLLNLNNFFVIIAETLKIWNGSRWWCSPSPAWLSSSSSSCPTCCSRNSWQSPGPRTLGRKSGIWKMWKSWCPTFPGLEQE